jgi:hypothetical protein
VVWLSAPISKDRKEWRYIVEKNVSFGSPIIVVTTKDIPGSTIILLLHGAGETKKLIDVKKISDEQAVINEIDLNPLGFKIHGDPKGLHIGGHFLSGNTFEGAYSTIAIDV